MPKNIPYYEEATDEVADCLPAPAPTQAPPPGVRAPACAEPTAPPEESTASQELLNQIDQINALEKLLKDDQTVIEKAEKEAKEAVEKYPALKEKLYAARKPLECFRTQDWQQRILQNPLAQKDEVNAIIKHTDGAIAKQKCTVDGLSQELADLQAVADEKLALRGTALKEFQSTLGYSASVDEKLKAGLELATNATKEMTSHPATAFLLGKGAVGYLKEVGDIKCPGTFQEEVKASLARLIAAYKAARVANAAAENAALALKTEQKKYDTLSAGRDATIARLVSDLDGKGTAPDASVP